MHLPGLVGRLFSLVAALAAGIAPCFPADAAEVRGGEAVVVKAEETIADDLYVFGRQITIDGTVEGDLIAFGESITINGTVKGDIAAAGQAVLLTGPADDARIAGYVLKLGPKAKVDGDVLAAGFSLETEKDSTIAGDALFAGFQALLGGQIDKDLKGGVANCRLAGKIGGDVDLDVGGEPGQGPPPNFGPPPPIPLPSVPGGLTVTDTAEVTGKLKYLSAHEAKIDPAAKTGEVTHTRPAPAPAGQPAAPPQNPYIAAGLSRLRHVAAVLIIGVAVALCLPRASTAWADNIRTRPGPSLLSGTIGLVAIAGIFVLAIFAIVLVATLAGVANLGDLMAFTIVGGIVGYSALVVLLWLFAAFLAEALTGLAVGRFAMASNSFPVRLLAMVLGVVVVALVLSIPYVGTLLGWVVFLMGLGGFCLWLVGVGGQPEAALVAAPAGSLPPGAIPAKPVKG